MTGFDPLEDAGESNTEAPIQVDLYGFKLRSIPTPNLAEPRITTKSLLDDVAQSLLRICRDSVGFIADVFTAGRSIVRGIAAIPASVAVRIGRAHEISETRETDAAECAWAIQVAPESQQRSVAHLENVLDELRARGICVRVERLDSGQIAISLVRPENEQLTGSLADDAVSTYLRDADKQSTGIDRNDPSLNSPISDFSLSVRGRKALDSMGIRTLGDLTSITAEQLLAIKGVGETTLNEIRDMLASKELKLADFWDVSGPRSDREAVLLRPIADLKLSLRARKAMISLGMNTLGELVQCTPSDLLEIRNFGERTLSEVREKLASIGLRLLGD
jgi:hypothetical protein